MNPWLLTWIAVGCLIATAAHLATTWRMRGQAPDAPRNGGDASSII